MNTVYFAGSVCGVLAVLLVCWLISLKGKKAGVQKKDFDERQRAIRDRGFRYAFLTLVGYLAVYLLLDSIGVVWCNLGGGLFLGVILSLLVHVLYSIYNNAYFKLIESPRSWFVFFGFIAFINIAQGMLHRISGSVRGVLSFADMHLVVGIFVLVIMVNILIKKALDKREMEE